MSLSKWLMKDSLSFGIMLGLLIPVPAALFFAAILRLVQYNLHFLSRVRDADILLLGIAVNLVVMRFYFVKFKLADTGKGIMLVSVLMVILFFVFLKNSSQTFPF
jgi:hypothetical protein